MLLYKIKRGVTNHAVHINDAKVALCFKLFLLTLFATLAPSTVKLEMFACSKYCVFFIFSFMRVLINATDVRRQISETEGTDLCVF